MLTKVIYGIVAILAVYMAFRKSVMLGIAILVLLLLAGGFYLYGKMRFMKANASYNSGDPEAAIKAYKELIDKGKASIDQRILYANMCLREGKLDESMTQLNKVLGVSRKGLGAETWCKAKLTRALVEYKQGGLAEALEEAKEVFDENGYKTVDSYSIMTYLMFADNEDPKAIAKLCEEAYDLDENNRDILDNLFVCYYRLRDYEQAEELADILTRDYPEFVEAYYHGAMMQIRLGNTDKAKEYLAHLNAECKFKYLTTVTKEEISALGNAINDGTATEYLDKLDAEAASKVKPVDWVEPEEKKEETDESISG